MHCGKKFGLRKQSLAVAHVNSIYGESIRFIRFSFERRKRAADAILDTTWHHFKSLGTTSNRSRGTNWHRCKNIRTRVREAEAALGVSAPDLDSLHVLRR
jgi:hypothetical protein